MGDAEMSDTFVPAEFDCCECGRHIVVVSSSKPPNPRLCGCCTHMPGWFRIPDVRALIDPGHDGNEVDHKGKAS